MRRPRYQGRHPRAFHLKYKEHQPERYPDAVRQVIASGKTPAGAHRPIMVTEVLAALAPVPGEIAVDCTLGYGGHAQAVLARLRPGGRLIGLDVDPIQLPRTEARLRAQGADADVFQAIRTNFAGLAQALAGASLAAADLVFADLGVSSMQLDDPSRGFTFKDDGPLDMRMNPTRGEPASALLARIAAADLAALLREHADEPEADALAAQLAGRDLPTTAALSTAIADARAPGAGRHDADARARTVRRVFQALRIAVNDEFGALDALLRALPTCLAPGGRAAVLTFHSGEDRRVKKAFQSGARAGVYAATSEVIRPSPDEVRANPRAAPAKLRWVRRTG